MFLIVIFIIIKKIRKNIAARVIGFLTYLAQIIEILSNILINGLLNNIYFHYGLYNILIIYFLCDNEKFNEKYNKNYRR